MLQPKEDDIKPLEHEHRLYAQKPNVTHLVTTNLQQIFIQFWTVLGQNVNSTLVKNLHFSPQKSRNFATNTGFSPHFARFGHIFHTAWHDAVLLRRF